MLVHVRGNWGKLAPTLAGRVESREVELDDGSATSIGYLELPGRCDVGVEDLQRGPDENGGSDVEEAIGSALVSGPRASREVKAQVVAELGCSKRTVERAAVRMAERIELVIESGGFPRTTSWTLGSGDTPASTAATSTNTRRVATGSYAVVTGDSAPSRDSDATLQTRGATVGSCCCADGGDEPTDDGRCSRCEGRL